MARCTLLRTHERLSVYPTENPTIPWIALALLKTLYRCNLKAILVDVKVGRQTWQMKVGQQYRCCLMAARHHRHRTPPHSRPRLPFPERLGRSRHRSRHCRSSCCCCCCCGHWAHRRPGLCHCKSRVPKPAARRAQEQAAEPIAEGRCTTIVLGASTNIIQLASLVCPRQSWVHTTNNNRSGQVEQPLQLTARKRCQSPTVGSSSRSASYGAPYQRPKSDSLGAGSGMPLPREASFRIGSSRGGYCRVRSSNRCNTLR